MHRKKGDITVITIKVLIWCLHLLSKKEYISIGLMDTVKPFSTPIPSYNRVKDICFTLSLYSSGNNSSKLTWKYKKQ